jgi:Cft2 family RNA processing exonuclease
MYITKQWFRIGIDMGAVQWYNKWHNQTYLDNLATGIPKEEFPELIIITHSHHDHAGRIPVAIQEWFSWNFYCTQETYDAILILLEDSLHIMNKEHENWVDAKKVKLLKTQLSNMLRFIQKYGKSIDSWSCYYDNETMKKINNYIKNYLSTKWDEIQDPISRLDICKHELALYKIETSQDIGNFWKKDALSLRWSDEIEQFKKNTIILPINKKICVSEGVYIELFEAWHILWSAQVLISEDWFWKTVYSWDIWQIKSPLYLPKPKIFTIKDKIKAMVIESTYWDRNHKNREEEDRLLYATMRSTPWPVLYADFANHRHTDSLQKTLKEDLWRVIIADWVSAREFYKLRLWKPGYEYLTMHQDKIVRAPLEISEKLALLQMNPIIFAPSGMISAWSIMHYLPLILKDENALLVIPWYQSQWTLWYEISTKKTYTIDWITQQVKCKLFHCASKSWHASMDDLQTYISSAQPQQLILVHWQNESKEALKSRAEINEYTKKTIIPCIEWHPYNLNI